MGNVLECGARDGKVGHLIDFASKDDVIGVKSILSSVSVNEQNLEGKTALWVAASSGCMNVLAVLLEEGANPNIPDSSEGNTPLMEATARGLYEVVRVLLDKGAAVNTHNHRGYTALMFAALKGSLPLVELLISRGADCNARAEDGNTALLHAVQHPLLEMVKALVERGHADIVVRDKMGVTAIRKAAMMGHLNILEYLDQQEEKRSQEEKSKALEAADRSDIKSYLKRKLSK
eukprot:GILI01027931.1.p1 GENE.GILI01027931.1~~GILI01027931.1.p1  ORF type:complete len:233 (+),score=74.30 GILI01027931.1:115-813(+)